MGDFDEFPLNPKDFAWTIYGKSAADIQPERGDLVEALMCLAYQVRDESGLKVYFRLPPAFANLLIDVLTSENPLASARALLYGEPQQQ